MTAYGLAWLNKSSSRMFMSAPCIAAYFCMYATVIFSREHDY